ncbi:SMI1/KNR4 family protein [Chryseobacterium sp. FH1]|uniref:SMI1/KNR4 family protein n=1 Tax=Chryseobacterium sp. FH1 TaxID=1233951 RepID=UPI0010399B60|nr:SMI1/KNR4 family protein [Chryseobacterium sp. FH1]
MNDFFEYPKDYLEYMDNNENEIYSDSGFIELFPLEGLDAINNDYETEIYVPNFVTIGTNGGGAGIFINKNNNKIYSIPFIGMEEKDAVLLADSFTDFIDGFKGGGIDVI